MCGRFTQSSPPESVAKRFEVDPQRVLVLDWKPRYNLAPTQSAMVVRTATDGQRQLDTMSWGFVPGWAKDLEGMPKPINARAETVDSKPMFRSAFRSHRCLIPCDGFYEWQATQGGKQPYFIRMHEEGQFALAGLWDHWEGEGRKIDSFTILVTEANALMSRIHDRMPVILPEQNWNGWLNPKTPGEAAKAMHTPYAAEQMTMYPVSKRVNSPGNEGQELLESVAGDI